MIAVIAMLPIALRNHIDVAGLSRDADRSGGLRGRAGSGSRARTVVKVDSPGHRVVARVIVIAMWAAVLALADSVRRRSSRFARSRISRLLIPVEVEVLVGYRDVVVNDRDVGYRDVVVVNIF